MTISQFLVVFLGGGLGSTLRYAMGQMLAGQTSGGFPLATFLCNVGGCFLIGLFSALTVRLGWSPQWRLLLTVGLCGGFTTFSTLTNDSLAMLQSGAYGMLALYMVGSLAAGLLAVWVGHSVA